MFTALDPEAYAAARGLFEALADNIGVFSILDGNTRGQVFVDVPEAPRYIMAWDELATLYIAGPAEEGPGPDPDPGPFAAALRAWTIEAAIDQAQRWGIPDLTLIYAPPTWQARLTGLFDRYRLSPALRHHYTHSRVPQPDVPLPAGYTLQAINADLLARDELPGLDWLGGWILSFWPTPEDFLDRGLGYVVLASPPEGTDAPPALVSLCISVFVSGAACEFGTATDEAHRSRGLSTAVTGASVNACLARSMDPIWHCWDDNGPSIAVARKTGFELQRRYEVLRLWVPEPGRFTVPSV